MTKASGRAAVVGVAVTAALVAGCGSKVAGAGASGEPPVLHLAGTALGEAAAAVAPAADSATSGKVAASYGAGGYVLKADFPATPDGAKVYRPDAVTQAEVQKLATAFGIKDPVTKGKDGYQAGLLTVSADGNWAYGGGCAADAGPDCSVAYDVATGTTTVGSGGAATSGSSGSGTASSGGTAGYDPDAAGASNAVDVSVPNGPSTPPNAATKPSSVPGSGPAVDPGTINTSPAPDCCRDYTPPPIATDDVTRKAAEPILAALNLTSPHVAYGQATADPTVDGLRVTDAGTVISVNADSTISYASGRLASVTAGAKYPVISAKDAYAQLPPRAVPAIACAEIPGTPVPCPTFPPPVVTDIVLGLTLTTDDQGVVLVPAWLFTIESDQMATPVIAIDPKYIGASPTPSAGTIEPASAVPPVSGGSAAPDMPASYPAGNASGAPVPNTMPSAVDDYASPSPASGSGWLSLTPAPKPS